MKVNNKSYFLFFRIVLSILILIFLVDIVLSNVDGTISNVFEGHWPAKVSGALIVILAGIRVNYFSYEDDYEIIQIRSKSLIFGRFSDPATTRYEFPKRKIYDFEMQRFLFQKKLIIYLQTQTGIKKINKFDLSFVPLKELKNVMQSLDRIKKENTDKEVSLEAK